MGADKGGGVEDSSAGVSGVVPYLLLLPGVLILPFFSKGFRVICLCRCSQNSKGCSRLTRCHFFSLKVKKQEQSLLLLTK